MVTLLLETPYLPDDYGYIVLIEESDTDRILSEIWDDWRLVDTPWESITRRGDLFLGGNLGNSYE